MVTIKSTRRAMKGQGRALYDTRMIQRGARLRRSPFFDATLAAGCRSYTVYNHTLLPSTYDDPEAEYFAPPRPRRLLGRRRGAAGRGLRPRRLRLPAAPHPP